MIKKAHSILINSPYDILEPISKKTVKKANTQNNIYDVFFSIGLDIDIGYTYAEINESGTFAIFGKEVTYASNLERNTGIITDKHPGYNAIFAASQTNSTINYHIGAVLKDQMYNSTHLAVNYYFFIVFTVSKDNPSDVQVDYKKLYIPKEIKAFEYNNPISKKEKLTEITKLLGCPLKNEFYVNFKPAYVGECDEYTRYAVTMDGFVAWSDDDYKEVVSQRIWSDLQAELKYFLEND